MNDTFFLPRFTQHLSKSVGMLLGCLLINTPVLASDTIDLTQAYRLAEKNDLQWSAFKHAYQAQKQSYYQARSQLLPQIGLTGSASRKHIDPKTGQSSSYNEQQYGAQISQPLFRMDRWHEFKKAKLGDQQVDINYELQHQNFLIRILETYLSVLRSQDILVFRQAEESAIKRQKEQTDQQFNVGLIAKTDVHEAQAALDIAVVQRILAEKDQDLALRHLETLTGTQISNVESLTEDFPVKLPQPNQLSAWQDMALTKSLNLKVATLNEKMAEHQYDAQQAKRYPSIDLVGNYARNSNDGNSAVLKAQDADVAQLSLQFSLPIYAGGLLSANQKQAKYKHYQAIDEARYSKRELLTNISNLFRVVQAQVAAVNAQQQTIRSAESALKATQAGYEAGTRTVVDVLNSQRLLYQAKSAYADARYNYVTNSLRLKMLAGILDQEDLLNINQWLR